MARYQKKWCRAFATLLLAVMATSFGCVAHAQEMIVSGPNGPMKLSREQMKAMRAAQPGMMPGGPPPGAQPAQEAKPDDKDKKKEGDGEKKKEESTTVKRPEKPPRVPDPRELKVKLDDKGRVPPFNFIGQPWPDVMQWLANVSKCSLDWQELPNDYLNLTTQHSYSVDEVRDLINRHLNARGYISIQSGEVLSVFKLDKIDPSQVRRATEDQLYDLKPYDFVKVSFELPASMEVDKAKDDVKQVLSPTAKVLPLVASRRLLIMDSVANLRGVSELLNNERMVQDGRIVPKEFVLKHARPQQVIEILYVLLGMDPKAKPAQTDPQMQQQQMQMMQQMQQQGQGQNMAKLLSKDAPKVYLAYNRQRNSVLVNAPPDQMKVIEQTIAYLDVPYGIAGGGPGDTSSAGDNQRSMKKYPLTTLDPDKFVKTLEEIGGLSPYAEFKIDDNSKTLFALATESDHKKIASLVQNFDGSGRHFEVVWLRRLPADAVAATIYKLMAGQQDKDKDKNSRRSFFYDYYDQNRDDKKKDTVQGFGVDADIENNRLLLWATDVEMERVRELLVKLGEIPSGQADSRPVRLIEPSDGKPTAALLKELREAWSASGGNELIIKTPPETKTSPSDEEKAKKENADKTAVPGRDRSARIIPLGRISAQLAAITSAGATETDDKTGQKSSNPGGVAAVAQQPAVSAPTQKSTEAPAQSKQDAKSGAPVTVTVTADGRLLLSSKDTAALDRMEQLIEQLSPPQRRFKVYALKYIRAIDMYYDLKDYFKDDLETKQNNNNDYDFYYWPPRSRGSDDKSGPALSKRRKLMITWDTPSNSILVANASASQTSEIEQLIKEFDKPARSDSVELRQTAPIKIMYSKPTIIAAAVKEVYRDLLSAKDKEFDRPDGKGDKRSGSVERVTEIFYHGTGGGDDDNRSAPVKVGFDGALSLGADDVSGVLIVSAQKGIFDAVVQMVRELDAEAAPKTTVQVHHVNGNVSAEALQKALEKAVGKAWLGNRPEQQPNQTGPEGEKKPAKERAKAKAEESEKKD